MSCHLSKTVFLRACPGSGKTEVVGLKAAFEMMLRHGKWRTVMIRVTHGEPKNKEKWPVRNNLSNFSISGGFILVTDHRVLLLETICVSPVVFLVFAA